MASFLHGSYNVDRVLPYGSLAGGDFHRFSDIDIYVEGFVGSYWGMLRNLKRICICFAGKCQVYWVCQERCNV